jgi:hypothetical protein
MGFSSLNMEQWLAEARSASAEDPCFSTIDTLIRITGEGMQTTYVPGFTLKTHRPLQPPAEGSCTTWQTRRRQERHGILCERLCGGVIERRFVDEHQDNLFGPIRTYAGAVGQNEHGAKRAQEETKARYIDWIAEKDKASSVRISIFRDFRDVFRQDQRKPFDDACQSLESVFAWNLIILAARRLKKWCCELHAARTTLANHLSRDIDVRWITNAIGPQFNILSEPAVAYCLLSRHRGRD